MPDTLDASSLMASAYIYTCSSDQLALGLAGHTPVLGVFITAGGATIPYHPVSPRGPAYPIQSTCFRGNNLQGLIVYPPHMLGKGGIE